MLLTKSLCLSEFEVILYFAKWKVEILGGYTTKYYTEETLPRGPTLTLLYTIFNRKGTPKSYTFHWQKVRFSRTYLRMLHPC